MSTPRSPAEGVRSFTLIEVTVTLVLITIMAGVIVSVLIALGDTLVAGRAKARALHESAKIVHTIRSDLLFSRIKDDGGKKRSELKGQSCPDRSKGGPPGHEILEFQKVIGYEEDPPASGKYIRNWSGTLRYEFIDDKPSDDIPGYILREYDRNKDGAFAPDAKETTILGGKDDTGKGNSVLDCCFDIDLLNDQFIVTLVTQAGDERRKPPTDFRIKNQVRVKPIN